MTLTGTTALVTGASRGFGRAIAAALHEAGADVVGVARDPERLRALHAELGGSLTTEAADVADPVVAGSLLERHRPRTLVLNAGAALRGSPLSGGYAGAKAAIRLMAGYAAEESARAGLGIRFVAILPKLTPATDLGAAAVAAYAGRAGVGVREYLEQAGPVLAPERVGREIAQLAASADQPSGAYLLTPEGLSALA